MRRRIIAAAVACDYAALAKLGDEKGKGIRISFGDDEGVARYWRELEEKDHEPVLARLVKILNVPFTTEGDVYYWPSAFREHPTDQDFADLKGLYPDAQLQAMAKDKSYLGLRAGITSAGDWQLAVSGD
jgi:hypothetical protein